MDLITKIEDLLHQVEAALREFLDELSPTEPTDAEQQDPAAEVWPHVVGRAPPPKGAGKGKRMLPRPPATPPGGRVARGCKGGKRPAPY